MAVTLNKFEFFNISRLFQDTKADWGESFKFSLITINYCNYMQFLLTQNTFSI